MTAKVALLCRRHDDYFGLCFKLGHRGNHFLYRGINHCYDVMSQEHLLRYYESSTSTTIPSSLYIKITI